MGVNGEGANGQLLQEDLKSFDFRQAGKDGVD
jgi:hypothetical protein